MEDLDRERSQAAYAEAAIEDLRWLGIRWQEGPDVGGPSGPYEQSRRMNVHLAAWRRLLKGGFLYPCRCSRKDLESAAGAPHEGGSKFAQGSLAKITLDDEPVYPGTCRGLQGSTEYKADLPEGVNWRFRVRDGEMVWFKDENLGMQRFVAGRDFGDFVVWRRDGVPSYQLACVADDAAMGITEVVRGADLLKSTARQILLNRALGFENPAWYHCKLVMDHNGQRLAKRHDSLSLRTLRQSGITPMRVLSAEVPVEA
jgi:glutamyl-tRNA synthetase